MKMTRQEMQQIVRRIHLQMKDPVFGKHLNKVMDEARKESEARIKLLQPTYESMHRMFGI